MFWILRRTGAANFFNSFNNNCSTSKTHGSNSQTCQDKYVKRPPRKAYGRLSVDSDDASSAKQIVADSLGDIDNFALIPSENGNGEGKNTTSTKGNKCAAEQVQSNGLYHKSSQRTNVTDNGCGGGTGYNKYALSGDDNSCIGMNCCNSGINNSCVDEGGHCTATDCQGNYTDRSLCQYNINNYCDMETMSKVGSNATLKGNSASWRIYSSKEVNENTINRLHAMAMSDNDDYDESLTCNVCDRAFHCHRQLASHQQKKRHFGCGGCDSLFPSLMLLEHHKEEFEHWSDDDINQRVCCRRNRADDYFTDTDSFTSEAESEDLERLL